jgi:hypothetical protein
MTRFPGFLDFNKTPLRIRCWSSNEYQATGLFDSSSMNKDLKLDNPRGFLQKINLETFLFSQEIKLIPI